ncbi:molybdate ABC transporter substrate-binding protein [Actinoallomurus rhizosphaericola]|uniref:molybdate ABC transporter substrate-binding protein n=1 Tax=Actinoallomurus rhizosphaericola TaxID=2952536 RepID=UPI002091B6C0|nr:molybdate ABC transporter substrate-binding protein [Actinoallomurus rhizosphaericola]MCO5992334.1 molybdate ABC transporter substrate-binding protein [Actinoallomurus rhizosphaericola]
MRRHRTTLRIASIAGLAAALATGCGDTGAKDGPGVKSGTRTVVVFAAASLTESFTALGRTFEASHPGVRVKFNFGGSSALAQQIDQGAPADVFAAASPATMKQVTDAGGASAPRVFARNRLEIAVPKGASGTVTSLQDLANPKTKVVLCAPQVPCGAAALKALKAAGLTVKPVSQEQDVKAALTKVRLNEADAALVYRTDVKAAAGQVQGIDFPEAAQAINDYPIAALTKAPQPGLAGEFVQSVLSPQGQATLQQAGFERP